MLHSTYDDFLRDVDSSRIWRVRELSNFRALAAVHNGDSYSEAIARAAVVIGYSHWEGFWSDCISAYMRHRVREGRRPVLVNRNFLIGLLGADFNSLRDRNFSDVAKKEFVNSIFSALRADFAAVKDQEIRPRSNFDFARLTFCAEYLDLDISPFQKHRNKIDREVVGWRHSIAHGDNPEIDMTAVDSHLTLIETLTGLIKDAFLDHIEDSINSVPASAQIP